MSGAVLEFPNLLVTTTCPECGAQFAVAQRYLDVRRSDSKTFFCPNGHGQSFRESDADRLRKKLDQAQRDLADSLMALQGQRTMAADAECERDRAMKKLERVKNGVCPCCKRSFVALARHMKTKHPDFTTKTK